MFVGYTSGSDMTGGSSMYQYYHIPHKLIPYIFGKLFIQYEYAMTCQVNWTILLLLLEKIIRVRRYNILFSDLPYPPKNNK